MEQATSVIKVCMCGSFFCCDLLQAESVNARNKFQIGMQLVCKNR